VVEKYLNPLLFFPPFSPPPKRRGGGKTAEGSFALVSSE